MLRTALTRPVRGASTISRTLITVPPELVDLQTKIRENKPISIRNLRQLLLRAHQSYTDLTFALKAVRLYQRAGKDFTPEVSSLVIKTAIANKQPQLAAEAFLKADRLSAWLTKRSAAQLVSALAASDAGVEPAVAVLKLAEQKGLKITQAAAEIALKGLEDNEELAARVKAISEQALSVSETATA